MIFESMNGVDLQNLYDRFPFLINGDIKMELEDWRLFWFYYLNSDFKQAFLLSKYICWDQKVSQTISVNENTNPFRFYANESKGSILKVLIFTPNE